MPYQKRISRTKNNRDPDSYFRINNELRPLIKRARDINAPASAAQIFDSNKDIELSKRSGAYLKSSFYRDFALCPELNPMGNSRISFSRGSGATKIGPTGLVEFGPENLLIRSEELDLAWAGVGTTIIANSGIAPNGTLSAEFVREDSVNSIHNINFASAGLPTGTITVSVYAKAQGRDFLQFFLAGSATAAHVNFSLVDGIVSFSNAVSSRIVSVGNGWYRCIATFNTSATSGIWFSLATNSTQARNTNYQGSGTFGILLWGAQAERFSSAREYIPTSGSIVYGPRFDYDPITRECKGLLLEESRTNLALQSNVLSAWTNINTTESTAPASPFNFESAWKIEETAATGLHDMQTSVSGGFTGGTAYSVSCYLAPAERTSCQVILLRGSDFCLVTVNLSTFTATSGGVSNFSAPSGITVTAAANGFYLLNFTTTPTNTGTGIASVRVQSGSYAGSAGSGIYFAGMQVEVGGFATSYIPTTGATVQRAADVCQITGTNFSAWYNQSEGTFAAEFISAGGTLPRVFELQGITKRLVLAHPVASWDNNGIIADPTINGINAVNKIAASYNATVGAASANGNAAVSAAITNTTGATGISIGDNPGVSRSLNGTLARLTYYTAAFSTAQLQTLSS
jgi:hypothetical protein